MKVSSLREPDTRVFTDLGNVLLELIDVYERLETLGAQRDGAIQRADLTGLSACIEQESALIARIADIETRRVSVVQAIGRLINADPQAPPTMTQLAGHAPAVARDALQEHASRLRDLVHQVRQRSESSRQAAQMLANHMTGLIRQVNAKLNHARTYGQRGVVESGARVMTSIDVTS